MLPRDQNAHDETQHCAFFAEARSIDRVDFLSDGRALRQGLIER
jgi:hypothetical protein